MNLTLQQLSEHLHHGPLGRLYWIAGDEPLQVKEAGEQIRAAAKRYGYEPMKLSTTPPTPDELTHALNTPSLFSNQRFIECRLKQNTLGKTLAPVLKTYLQGTSNNTCLLLIGPKLEKATQQTQWMKALAQQMHLICVYPITHAALPRFIRTRMQAAKLPALPEIEARLASTAEGNLLAIDQAIYKLRCLQEMGKLNTPSAIEALSECSRFSSFDLVESCLAGETTRSLKMIQQLEAEKEPPVLVLGALCQSLRLAAHIASRETQTPRARLYQEYRIWKTRQAGFDAYLHRVTKTRTWSYLTTASHIDEMIKGVRPGDPWQALAQLIIAIGQ